MSDAKRKIINDPIYGLISIYHPTILKIVDHPYFQRLRRIRQMALAEYVFPSATHTRFQHSLGAFYLMTKAVDELRDKGVDISEEEKVSAQAAMLLHDIGHGPFSHSMENYLFSAFNHEQVSKAVAERLNVELNGELDMVMEIFDKSYSRKFLCQLFSGQLDLDRMDYLSRDSYFTGVAEGVIGYDRILKMINVYNDELVIEEKGIYSIEQFLIARKLMYTQVYLHKTVWCVEKLLVLFVKRLRYLMDFNKIDTSKNIDLDWFLKNDKLEINDENIQKFMLLDDMNIIHCIKENLHSEDVILDILCDAILNRKIFKIKKFNTKKEQQEFEYKLLNTYKKNLNFSSSDANFLFFSETTHSSSYDFNKEPIKVLAKDDSLSSLTDYPQTLFHFIKDKGLGFMYTGYYSTEI